VRYVTKSVLREEYAMPLRASLNHDIRVQAQGRTDKPEQQRRIEAVKALSELCLARNTEHAKTTSLRALRLTKEAKDAIIPRDRRMSKRAKAVMEKNPAVQA
jgi:hypothetical protein